VASPFAILSASSRGIPNPVQDVFGFPASFAQERLWFFDQFQPGSPVYNIPTVMRLPGRLDVRTLERSLNEIVRRHEALRTTFAAVDGRPVQVIAATLSVELPVIELRGLPRALREGEAARLAGEEARRPFDLARGPLLRASLLRLDDTEHVLLLTLHHIVSDGWSMGVLFQELAALYDAYVRGGASPLPELPIQYADFAHWQRQRLQGSVLESQLSYWRGQLGGIPGLLELPTDRPGPALQTFRGAVHGFVLPAALAKAVGALGRRQETTPFMTLLAAFKVLLYRCTGQTDVVVGTPIANRTRAELEGLIGFFVNTLVLRTDLGGDPSFRELLGRMRAVTLGAYAHQDLPFERLVEALQPERNLSHHPIFQVMFVFQNTPTTAAAGTTEARGAAANARRANWADASRGEAAEDVSREAAAPARPPELGTGTSKFDLTLSLAETPQGLLGTFEYNSDLFDAATIERMAGLYRTLLESIVATPDRRVSELPLLTSAQRHQLVVEWNATQAEYPHETCVQHVFEAQVDATPDAVALVFQGQSLSYRELNARANQVAHYLQGLGVGPEVRVGLCVERSLEMVIGLLGILKAGGAYVPLDPTYPQERLAFMLGDAGIAVLLTQERLRERLPASSAHLLLLDADWSAIAQSSDANPTSSVSADNLAYVIYTSGSTGRPKGVMIEHQGLCNVVQVQRELFSVKLQYRVLQFASISFDASIFELVMAIASGATLCLGTTESLHPGPALAQFLEMQRITLATFTPSTLVALSESTLFEPATVIVVGEVCPADLAVKWAEHRLLSNAYGPTETTIWATVGTYDRSSHRFPIGRPIANVRIYILDANLSPVPVGIVGEIYIGGESLARGYLERPDLTAEKFIADPFSGKPGARLYQTGDLARYRADGNIEYLGRIDHQVKLRGFRIELGEIEAVLRRHPDVREAVVLAREDAPGDKRLVAYVVPSPGTIVASGELRVFLKRTLPEYMLPAHFVQLDELPLTPSGKVHREGLPAPDATRPELAHSYEAPRSALEIELTRIWGRILRVEQVGIHDNFFELGGHSLLATQVVSQVRDTFHVELPLRMLFEAPTVADFAAVIAKTGVAPKDDHASVIKRVGWRKEDRLLATLDRLSDDEMDALLREMLAEQAFLAASPATPDPFRQNRATRPIERVTRTNEERLLSTLDHLTDREVDSLLREMLTEQALVPARPAAPELRRQTMDHASPNRELVGPGNYEQLLATLDELSDDEVDSLLTKMLIEEKDQI
jgi:amino acid adenylation domain-containing protein